MADPDEPKSPDEHRPEGESTPWPDQPYWPPSPRRDGPAWEWRARIGVWRALWLTVKEVLGQPANTFEIAQREGGGGAPLTFYLVMMLLTKLAYFLITLPFTPSTSQLMGQLNIDQSNPWIRHIIAYQNVSPLSQIFGIVILGPIAWTLSVFISAGLTHLFLLLYGGARYGFETTFRAIAYTGGACAVLTMIPLCGGLFYVIAWGIIVIIALVKMHETDTWRATMAVITPGLLAITCCMGVLSTFIYINWAKIQQFMNP